MKRKLIVIVGPTASGKSGLAIVVAKRWGGEIISADSRQVYKGMDIGTGKVTKKEMEGIPHHLLDVESPRPTFTVSHYQRMARKAIEKIIGKNKLPILCGGTGLYVRSVVDGLVIPEVPPNFLLRKKLNKLPTSTLFKTLCSLDPIRAKQIDRQNPRRLVRAIEIVKHLGKVPPLTFVPFDGEILIIGVSKTKKEQKNLIHARLIKRFRLGMIAEVQKLHTHGITWKRLESFGLEYRDIARYLQGKITKQELYTELEGNINRYAKRQMTWFKRDVRIHWVKSNKHAIQLVKRFLF